MLPAPKSQHRASNRAPQDRPPRNCQFVAPSLPGGATPLKPHGAETTPSSHKRVVTSLPPAMLGKPHGADIRMVFYDADDDDVTCLKNFDAVTAHNPFEVPMLQVPASRASTTFKDVTVIKSRNDHAAPELVDLPGTVSTALSLIGARDRAAADRSVSTGTRVMHAAQDGDAAGRTVQPWNSGGEKPLRGGAKAQQVLGRPSRADETRAGGFYPEGRETEASHRSVPGVRGVSGAAVVARGDCGSAGPVTVVLGTAERMFEGGAVGCGGAARREDGDGIQNKDTEARRAARSNLWVGNAGDRRQEADCWEMSKDSESDQSNRLEVTSSTSRAVRSGRADRRRYVSDKGGSEARRAARRDLWIGNVEDRDHNDADSWAVAHDSKGDERDRRVGSSGGSVDEGRASSSCAGISSSTGSNSDRHPKGALAEGRAVLEGSGDPYLRLMAHGAAQHRLLGRYDHERVWEEGGEEEGDAEGVSVSDHAVEAGREGGVRPRWRVLPNRSKGEKEGERGRVSLESVRGQKGSARRSRIGESNEVPRSDGHDRRGAVAKRGGAVGKVDREITSKAGISKPAAPSSNVSVPSDKKKKIPVVSHAMATGPWTEAELPKAVSVLKAAIAPLHSTSARKAVDALSRAEAAALCSSLGFGDGGALAEAAAAVAAAAGVHGLVAAPAAAAAALIEAAAGEPTTYAVPKRAEALAAAQVQLRCCSATFAERLAAAEPPAAAATLLPAAAALAPPPPELWQRLLHAAGTAAATGTMHPACIAACLHACAEGRARGHASEAAVARQERHAVRALATAATLRSAPHTPQTLTRTLTALYALQFRPSVRRRSDLLHHVHCRSLHMTAPEAVTTARCLAHLRIIPHGSTAAALLAALARTAPDMNAVDVGMAWWALGRMRLQSTATCHSALLAATRREAARLSAVGATTTLWAWARLASTVADNSNEGPRAVGSHHANGAPVDKSREVEGVRHSSSGDASAAALVCEQFLRPDNGSAGAVDAATRPVGGTPLATGGDTSVDDDFAVAAVLSALQRAAGDLTPQGTANVAWALGRLRLRDRNTWRTLHPAIVRAAPRLSGAGVRQVLEGVAESPDEPLPGDVVRSMLAAVRHVTPTLRESELLGILHALRRLGWGVDAEAREWLQVATQMVAMGDAERREARELVAGLALKEVAPAAKIREDCFV